MPPVHTKRWNKRTVKQTTRGEYERVVNELFTLHHAYNKDGEPIPVDIPLSRDAEAVWAEYFNAHAQRQAETEDDDRVAAYAKLEQYAARLALVIHFVRWAANDPTLTNEGMIDATSLRAGVTIARWFCHEAERVYALLGECVEDEEDRKTIELIGRKGNRITVRELQQASRRFPTADDGERALDRLVASGIGYWEEVQPTEKSGAIRGRPTREFVLAASANVYENPADGSASDDSVDVDASKEITGESN